MKIYYMCPDLTAPTGGIREIYRHVDLLNASGYEAYVFHHRFGFKCSWFTNNTKVAYQSVTPVTEEDILVFPEVYGPNVGDHAKGIRKVMFNQNVYYMFNLYDYSEDMSTPYLDPSVLGTMVVSEDSKWHMDYIFPDHKTIKIINSVDTELFSYRKEKKRQIAFMPRKHPEDSVHVFNALKFRGSLKGWKLVPIENKSIEDTAEIMAESAIFVNFSKVEGFGYPPAEAMACGSLAVGSHAWAAREYMHPVFSIPVHPGDLIGLCSAIERAIAIYDNTPDVYEYMCLEASKYITENYSVEKGKASILAAWKELLT